MTVNILLKANEIGVDAWSSAVSSYAPSSSVFDDDLARHIIQYRAANLPSLSTEKEQKKQVKYLTQLIEKDDRYQWLDERKQELIHFDVDKLELITSISANKLHLTERLIYEYGKYRMLETLTKGIPNFKQKTLHYTTYVEYEVSSDLKQLLVVDGFDYRYLNLDQI